MRNVLKDRWYKTHTELPIDYVKVIDVDGYDCTYVFPNGVEDSDETAYLSEIDINHESLEAFGFTKTITETFESNATHTTIITYVLSTTPKPIIIKHQITDNIQHLYNSEWFIMIDKGSYEYEYKHIDYINDIISEYQSNYIIDLELEMKKW